MVRMRFTVQEILDSDVEIVPEAVTWKFELKSKEF